MARNLSQGLLLLLWIVSPVRWLLPSQLPCPNTASNAGSASLSGRIPGWLDRWPPRGPEGLTRSQSLVFYSQHGLIPQGTQVWLHGWASQKPRSVYIQQLSSLVCFKICCPRCCLGADVPGTEEEPARGTPGRILEKLRSNSRSTFC